MLLYDFPFNYGLSRKTGNVQNSFHLSEAPLGHNRVLDRRLGKRVLV